MRWLDPWAIMSIFWTNFKDFRDFFGIACTKADMLEVDGRRPVIKSLEDAVRNIAGGMMLVRHDIGWDFKREYFPPQTLATENATRTSTALTTKQTKKLQGQTPQPIDAMLQPMFAKCGYKLRLNTLIRYANTNINEMLGSEGTGYC